MIQMVRDVEYIVSMKTEISIVTIHIVNTIIKLIEFVNSF